MGECLVYRSLTVDSKVTFAARTTSFDHLALINFH